MADVVRSEYNDSGWVTYREYSDGYWYKREYDDNGREIYSEDSKGRHEVYF
jgi:hypothetical protein